jgi:hypothetical protein
MYSTTSILTKNVCKNLGFIFEIQFVQTMSRNGKVYVKGTCGKPDEFRALRMACKDNGYIYKGLIPN